MSNPETTAELFEDRGYSEAEYKELEQMYARTLGSINAGEIVKGRIVHIGDNEVALILDSSPKELSLYRNLQISRT